MAGSGIASDVTPVVAARTGVRVADWREAIRVVCAPLVAAQAVRSDYVAAAISIVEEHGPYIVLMPGVALAHARPEDGALRLGIAVALLDRSVAFGHPTNDPVDIVFAFGSPDRGQHVGLLAALSRRLRSGLVADLRGAANDDEAQRLLEGVMSDVD
jgi:ascorbate PTS system EIIA or EIIAB component